ncbi:hypothetical protein [Aquibacillus saliphilus]|uniref:hypothetical protein n=1 Tax=Aquibacillus saliphilus TaxID=1909422 RepID=UPI001CF035B5|nr:hypothetical protein [Aquibacillus saliphilus]
MDDIPEKFTDTDDILGNKYNKFLVLDYDGWYSKGNPTNKRHYYKCLCDCGNPKTVQRGHLISGRSKNCGCGRLETLSKVGRTHGLTNTRIYHIHFDIKRRCYSENNHAYEYYGGRGIKVCDEWTNKENGFINFYNWSMKNGYSDDLTVDRIDSNGDYEPENCRWVDRQVQAENTRQAVKVNAIDTETGEEFSFPTIASCKRFTGADPKTMKRSNNGQRTRGKWRFKINL